MEKEFIGYNEALALKELGFDESCFGYYIGGDWDHDEYDMTLQFEIDLSKGNYLLDDKKCTAPTFSQAFRWFREKHGLWMTFTYDDCDCEEEDDDCNDCDVCWYIGKCFEYGIGPLFFHDINDFKTLEEAELAGLKKLIEIVKEKK